MQADTIAVGGSGLSPRVRGNLSIRYVCIRPSRSIPACAGEPPTWDCSRPSKWVYPRVCGGTSVCHRQDQPDLGLSPRVRGNRVPGLREVQGTGSIPACAGEPWNGTITPPPVRVYPRVCGGTAEQAGTALRGIGLSPRVRGNRTALSGIFIRLRSIPACAGEPRCSFVRPATTPVYPRVCGGTCPVSINGLEDFGLSPRVRGNPNWTRWNRCGQRSIPACAGEPCPTVWEPEICAVYPRVCGGTLRYC